MKGCKMEMNARRSWEVCCLGALIMALAVTGAPLKKGFYHPTCPSAERLVREAVGSAVAKNPGIAAGIIRLQFHDCIVRGCDASLLLDSTAGNIAEKDSGANPVLRGFEVIDDAKARVEAQCPGTVSCADVLSFAARDSAFFVGGINYAVPGGRRDGNVSLASDVPGNVAPITSDVDELKTFFSRKGLTLKEMVALSGAHSIGVAPCGAFESRLYFFNETTPQDPSLDPNFAKILKKQCPEQGSGGGLVNLDVVTPKRLDNQFYLNLKKGMGLLASDQTLESSPLTAVTVRNYRRNQTLWKADFASAMVKMTTFQVLTGAEGEIRKNCRVVNKK